MRVNLFANRPGWPYKLDSRKIILIAFLLRLIAASTYDIYASLNNKEVLLPDGRYYSIRGRYVALLLNGYDRNSFTKDMLPRDSYGQAIFFDAMNNSDLNRWKLVNESDLFTYILGGIYFILGYFTMWGRIFNIILSIASAYFFFKIANRQFGKLTANIFLLIILFLPSQFLYSITLSKDFLRLFIGSLILFLLYGGVICPKRQKI